MHRGITPVQCFYPKREFETANPFSDIKIVHDILIDMYSISIIIYCSSTSFGFQDIHFINPIFYIFLAFAN